jgi:hypothetical protein
MVKPHPLGINLLRWFSFLLFLLAYGFVFGLAMLQTFAIHGVEPTPFAKTSGTVVTFIMAPLYYWYAWLDGLLFPHLGFRLPDSGYIVCFGLCASIAGYFLVLRPSRRFIRSNAPI